jgi:hypothetical protein
VAASVDVRRRDRTYQAQVVPIFGAGSAVGLAVVQDVTEERRAAERAGADRVVRALDEVRLHGEAPMDDEVTYTLAVAAPLAEALAPDFGGPEAPGGDDMAGVRWLLERLVAPGPEDEDLLALVGWFATVHDVRKALAALAERG